MLVKGFHPGTTRHTPDVSVHLYSPQSASTFGSGSVQVALRLLCACLIIHSSKPIFSDQLFSMHLNAFRTFHSEFLASLKGFLELRAYDLPVMLGITSIAVVFKAVLERRAVGFKRDVSMRASAQATSVWH
jgi:hypothetical protein